MNKVSNITLRRDQEPVFVDANDFIKESKEASKPAFGRIIMPPRTGKTIIAGEIIASTGAHTTYLVPSIDLVDQTVSSLKTQLPRTEIGYLAHASSKLVERGVNVMTYQMAQMRYRNGELDPSVATAELVFADEAHVTMTELRMDLLRNAFDVRTPRIGLTATPDYNERRTLASHFPTLIHEIELTEAVELGLLAPFRWWLMEVDVDASNVRIIGDDYDQGELGRIMTNTALFNAVTRYRSSQAYDDTGTLICCKSRDQAYAMERYLAEHAQAEKVRARAILHETSPSDRHEFRRQFDCGEINTLITVGVLLQGWDAPRCKLLIDLAPSGSFVRSAQKYCRPLTIWEERWATILVFVPKFLTLPPITPSDVFAGVAEPSETGHLVAPKDTRKPKTHRPNLPEIKTDGVQVKVNVTGFSEVGNMAKLKGNWKLIRSIVRTAKAFDFQHPCSISEFKWTGFRHTAFVGCGFQLLRALEVQPSTVGYDAFIYALTPDGYAARWIARNVTRQITYADHVLEPVIEDFEERKVREALRSEASNLKVFRTKSASYVDNVVLGKIEACPEDTIDDAESIHQIVGFLKQLRPFEEQIIRMRFLEDGTRDDKATLTELGRPYHLSGERIRQTESQALSKLRRLVRQAEEGAELKLRCDHLLRSVISAGDMSKSIESGEENTVQYLYKQIESFGVGRYLLLVSQVIKSWQQAQRLNSDQRYSAH